MEEEPIACYNNLVSLERNRILALETDEAPMECHYTGGIVGEEWPASLTLANIQAYVPWAVECKYTGVFEWVSLYL